MAEGVVVDERRALIFGLAVGIPRHRSQEVVGGTTLSAALSGEVATKGGCCSRLTLAMASSSIYEREERVAIVEAICGCEYSQDISAQFQKSIELVGRRRSGLDQREGAMVSLPRMR